MIVTEARIDLAARSGLPRPLFTAATVFTPPPERLPAQPVVVFAFPGGGYSRGYYDIRWPGHAGHSQAEHHADHGLILVACDHLNVGGSATVDRHLLTVDDVVDANQATVDAILGRLRDGSLDAALPALSELTPIGLGQSLGGALLLAQQARHRTFSAIAVLGFSTIRTVLAPPPGAPPIATSAAIRDRELLRYAFHWDDVPHDLVDADITRSPLPPWASTTFPTGRGAPNVREPAAAAPWAAEVAVPVFLGYGARDVSPDPWAEPAAYRNSPDVTLAVFPTMAHMHNFASTRQALWDRLLAWMAPGLAPA